MRTPSLSHSSNTVLSVRKYSISSVAELSSSSSIVAVDVDFVFFLPLAVFEPLDFVVFFERSVVPLIAVSARLQKNFIFYFVRKQVLNNIDNIINFNSI